MDNKELGRLVLKQVETHPETFHMGVWGYQSSALGAMRGDCGTVACLAGWTLLFAGFEMKQVRRCVPETGYLSDWVFADLDGTCYIDAGIGNKAQELLGMSDDERVEDGDVFYEAYTEDALDRFRVMVEEDE